NEVRWDPAAKPGVANLLSILGAATGRDPEALAGEYQQYGALKADTAEAVVELLRPLQARYAELAADPGAVSATLARGAEKAQVKAAEVLARVQQALGLLPRS
ncbi:tryptophan--tRNA ligase, partial [cyanobacterium TDX16]